MIKCFLDYSQYVRWLSPRTIWNYKATLNSYNKFFKTLWKDINNPECITIEDINNYVIQQKKNWVTARTCNTRLNFMRRYLAYCREIKDIDCLNPVKIISSKVPERKLWYHNDTRKQMILDLVNNWYGRTEETIRRNKMMVYLLLHTGLRVSELNLKISEIEQSTQIIGKWSKHRFTYISPELMEMIKDFIAHTRYKWEYLFNTIYKWKIHKLSVQTIEKIFERMWEVLGFKVNPHSFRHTFATDLLKVPGCTIYDIATLLGHKDISTTAIYLGVDSQHLMDVQFALKY